MGYFIAAIAGLILVSLISKALKFAFKIVFFIVVVALAIMLLKNFVPSLF